MAASIRKALITLSLILFFISIESAFGPPVSFPGPAPADSPAAPSAPSTAQSGLSPAKAAGTSASTAAANEVRYGTGNWDAATYGNHRAVVRVESQADAVRVRIPWRRRDTKPDKKNVVVIDSATGARVKNVCPLAISREYGDFVFQPMEVPGDYYFYYLTNTSKGNQHYPTVVYNQMELTADEAWLKKWDLAPFKEPASPEGTESSAQPEVRRWGLSPSPQGFPEARVVEIQSIDQFNSFYPMEVIAKAEETERLLAANPGAAYLLFPEDRRFPVRMKDDLPQRWIEAGPKNEFSGGAMQGEFYAFQIGVFACREAIESIDVTFEDLKLVHPFHSSVLSRARGSDRTRPPARSNNLEKDDRVKTDNMTHPQGRASGVAAPIAGVIPAAAMHSFNTRGVNWDGRPFAKSCAVALGRIQPLWCGVQVPKDLTPGTYEGEITVAPKGLPESRIKLRLNIKDAILQDAGDSEPSRMSRLRWLDSKIAFDDDIVPPFTSVRVEGQTVSCLGRSLTIGDMGLPDRITSFFTPENTAIGAEGRELLASPFNLIVQDGEGNTLPWTPGKFEFTNPASGAVGWRAESQSGPLAVSVRGTMEFDGFVEFKVNIALVSSSSPGSQVQESWRGSEDDDEGLDVSDIRLEIPLARDTARYMMGMGYKGGLRPAEFSWTWDRTKNQDAIWLGDVNAGLQVSLRDENYSRPLNTNFYLSKPLNLPPSWWNDGEGICAVQETSASTVLFTASGGPRRIRSGDVLHFNFNLLLTPFKPLDTRSHFATRFFHGFRPVDEVVRAGANTINVHHATEINPYINYPFLRPAEMKAYIHEAHARGLRVKIYYTIRELSNRAAELFALRSLGDEIFTPGPGGGFSWLQEHLVSNYIAAWFVPELKDAAVINSGMSRWHNYYLEGLDWLVRNVGIDGLYIDDVAFDRTTMKRVRKILDRGRPGALIDLHSANQFNARDGFASSANLYLEHFPYLNRLWFGEYFDYNSAPDYWLVEISGIPFGLMGEMLQDGGNPWRGMVFGMTNRLPWSGQDPARLWKVWDEFGIVDAAMFGWWSPNCPVRCDTPDVLATAYVKKGSTMVALASWAKAKTDVRLDIDWPALGINAAVAKITAPAIADFQPEASFRLDDPVPVEPGKGWILIIKN